MKDFSQILQNKEPRPLLDATWNTTGPEPYILTPEEEEAIWNNEVERLSRQKAWKMAQMGLQEGAILQKLSEVKWAEEFDYEAMLLRANDNKHYALWQEQRRRLEREEEERKRQELKEFWTAKRLYQLMQWASETEHGKPLIVNGDTLPLIKTICFFLSGDMRFETELGFSFSKGLLLRGPSGLGKTHLVECVKSNELNPVRVLSMIEITDRVKSEGEYTVPVGGYKVLYLDDVGTEATPVKYYGTEVNWFKDFLELYYAAKKPFNALMFSTNNNFQELEEKYGFRVRSRIKDMFNIVDVKGKDLRGTV